MTDKVAEKVKAVKPAESVVISMVGEVLDEKTLRRLIEQRCSVDNNGVDSSFESNRRYWSKMKTIKGVVVIDLMDVFLYETSIRYIIRFSYTNYFGLRLSNEEDFPVFREYVIAVYRMNPGMTIGVATDFFDKRLFPGGVFVRNE